MLRRTNRDLVVDTRFGMKPAASIYATEGRNHQCGLCADFALKGLVGALPIFGGSMHRSQGLHRPFAVRTIGSKPVALSESRLSSPLHA